MFLNVEKIYAFHHDVILVGFQASQEKKSWTMLKQTIEQVIPFADQYTYFVNRYDAAGKNDIRFFVAFNSLKNISEYPENAAALLHQLVSERPSFAAFLESIPGLFDFYQIFVFNFWLNVCFQNMSSGGRPRLASLLGL